jgi:hypothetical protein
MLQGVAAIGRERVAEDHRDRERRRFREGPATAGRFDSTSCN